MGGSAVRPVALAFTPDGGPDEPWFGDDDGAPILGLRLRLPRAGSTPRRVRARAPPL